MKKTQLFSGGQSDFILCSADNQNVEKFKYTNKIMCCAWSPDGLYLAFGTYTG